MVRYTVSLVSLALLVSTSSCAQVSAASHKDHDTLLRTETETRTDDGAASSAKFKVIGDEVVIVAVAADTCSVRHVDVVDRTIATERELDGAGLHGLGAVAAVAAGAAVLWVAPGLSDKMGTTTDEETGERTETASPQAMAYVGGGLALAGGLGSAGWLASMGIQAIDSERHVGEVRLEGDWSEGEACNRRPMAGRSVRVLYGSGKEAATISSGTTTERGKFKFGRSELSSAYSVSKSVETDELAVFIGDEKRISVAATDLEGELGGARAAYIESRVVEAVDNAMAALDDDDPDTALSAVNACKEIGPNDERCADIAGLQKCKKALLDYKEHGDIMGVSNKLIDILFAHPQERTTDCVQQAQMKLQDKVDAHIAKAEAAMDREWAKQEKEQKKREETEGWYSTIFGSDYQESYYSNQYAGNYVFYYIYANDDGQPEWERADAKNALKRAAKGYCKWHKARVNEYGKEGVNKAIEAYCSGEGGETIWLTGDNGESIEIPRKKCISVLTKPKC